MRDYSGVPLQLYTRDFVLKSVIDVYDSIVWTDVYCGYGDFEVKIPDKIALGYDIQIGDLLQCSLSKKIMIIEGMGMEYSDDNSVMVTYKGRSLESILTRRILRKADLDFIVPGYVGDGIWTGAYIRQLWESIRYILERTIVTNSRYPNVEGLEEYDHYGLSSSPRGVPLLGYEVLTDQDMLQQNTPYIDLEGMTVYDYICSVLSYYGYGFSIEFNPAGVSGGGNAKISDRKMLFKMYNGVKRTYNQLTNDRVIFSPDDDTTFKMNTSIDMSSYGNVAMASGPHPIITIMDGEGNTEYIENVAERYPVEVYNTTSGLDRYEIFVDCSSIPNMDQRYGNVPYDREYIEAQMRFQAIQEVKKRLTGNLEMTPSVDFDPYREYSVHYYLGDLVTTMDDFGNISISRIAGFSHSLDSRGYSGHPIFESISPIGGYRVIENINTNNSDIPRETEDESGFRVTEQNNLDLFEGDDT